MNGIRQIDPIPLSKYIINFVNTKGYDVNHLKLQKLIYYVDAWHNVYFDVPLLGENFEAWMHGPVVREVWDYFKNRSVLFDPINLNGDVVNDLSPYLDSEQLEVINDVLVEYGDKSSYYLECLTHSEDPWRKARRGYAPTDRCEEIIPKDFMKGYYREKLYGQSS